jgi:hypothetical protein
MARNEDGTFVRTNAPDEKDRKRVPVVGRRKALNYESESKRESGPVTVRRKGE